MQLLGKKAVKFLGNQAKNPVPRRVSKMINPYLKVKIFRLLVIEQKIIQILATHNFATFFHISQKNVSISRQISMKIRRSYLIASGIPYSKSTEYGFFYPTLCRLKELRK
jgi:hypothetical protein